MTFTADQNCKNLAERAVFNNCGTYGPRTVCVKLDPGCRLHYSPRNGYWLGATFTDFSRVTYDPKKPKGERLTAHAV
ncbi:hypothetical protein [Stenotrophomonas phage BUCT603]|nr:hypothetical protein [Stenotrophomonas phage BUCT603]